jgi:hypothetical protein
MELNLKNKNWSEFLIGDIFNIKTGSLLSKEVLKKGKIARITATDNNNGIFDFYQKVDEKNYRELTNFISVSFLGSVFYHSYTASLDMKIHAIQLKGIELNSELAKFLIICIKRSVSIFSYGDQLSSTDLPKRKILLPTNSKGEPDFKFMEAYINHLKKEKLKLYLNHINIKISGLNKISGEVKPLNEKIWEEFNLNEIFTHIQRGKRLKKDDHKKGKIPYVSSTALNNGIDGFVGNTEKVRVFSNCLTIANSGSVGETFYQPFSVIASDHVTKLENKELNSYTYLFISTVSKRLSEKYSFNREINDNRIQKEKILLPINSQKEPDYEYMENYIKKIEFEKLNKYIQRING